MLLKETQKYIVCEKNSYIFMSMMQNFMISNVFTYFEIPHTLIFFGEFDEFLRIIYDNTEKSLTKI